MVRLLPTLLLLVILSTPVCALETTGVAVETLARGSVSWEGTELPAYPQGQPQVTILRGKLGTLPTFLLPTFLRPILS
jgi:hypothetical protein